MKHKRFTQQSANTSTRQRRLLPVCLALATLFGPGLAVARDLYWVGGVTSNNLEGRWSEGKNWEKVGGAYVQPTGGDYLHFKGSKTANDSDLAYKVWQGISFEAGAAAFTLIGVENFGLLGGGLRNLSSNLQRVDWGTSHGIVISQAQTWDGGTAGMVVTAGLDMQSNLTLQNNVTLNTHNDVIGATPEDDAALTIRANSKYIGSQGVTIALGTGTHGQLNVQGAGSSFSAAANLVVGDYGDAKVYVDTGGSVASKNAYLGKSGGSGSVSISGTGSKWANTANLYATQGDITIDQGGAMSTANAQIGNYTDTLATLTVKGSNSAFTATNTLSVGQGGLGVVELLQGGTVQAGDLDVGSGGIINLRGGVLSVLNASLTGTFNWLSGTLNFTGDTSTGDQTLLGRASTLANQMVLKVGGQLNLLAGNSLTLIGGGSIEASSLQVNPLGELSIGSFSSVKSDHLTNRGNLILAGGQVNGELVNEGTMSGSGFLAGGAFNNRGRFDQSGYVELGYGGGAFNTGVWSVSGGATLALGDVTASNQGTLFLDGAQVTAIAGSASLRNQAGGTLSGTGAIRTNFTNQGRVLVDGGDLAIDKGFSNSGQVLLGSAIASLSGGAISNTGRIEGLGQIRNAVSNEASGIISARGGTLSLTTALTNSGTLTAGRDATLLLLAGMSPNAGKIQLAGGTLDNNGNALTNGASGTISGYGDLRSGTLTNQGRMLLSGGTSAVYADVLGSNASQIILSGNSNTTFYGKVDIQSGAELRVSTGSVATFFELVQQRSGAKFTGSGAKRFEGGLSVGASPGLGTDEGDVEFGESNTYLAEIGGTSACTLACGSNDGLKNSSFDKYEVMGQLSFGGTLTLTSWNGFVAQAGQHFDLFDWGSTTGTFANIDSSGFKLAAGTRLDTSALYTTGEISVTTAVPEPADWALTLAGLAVLAWCGRRQRSGPVVG
jgi:T5SS/PEP-CTERM-associated repeat protein